MADATTPTTNYAEELKPVSGWKTFVTKGSAITGIIFSSVSTAVGVIAVFAPQFMSELVTGHTVRENKAGAVRAIGGAVAALGVVIGGVSMTAYSTANGATRARNFVKLQEELNGKAQGRA